MGLTTGENDQGLRKILDMTRLLSISILLIHFYIFCYDFFADVDMTHKIVDQFLSNLFKFNLFQDSMKAKSGALFLLIISLLGVKGKKDETMKERVVFTQALSGVLIYFISSFSRDA